MQNAKNLLPVALTDLGEGLPALPSGREDDGIRQETFHMSYRIAQKIPPDPEFKNVAGTAVLSPAKFK